MNRKYPERTGFSIAYIPIVTAIILILFFAFVPVGHPNKQEYYNMCQSYIKDNYEIDIVDYSDSRVKVTIDSATSATVVTYGEIDGVEHIIECKVRDEIGDYGNEPFYTYLVIIY